MKKEKWKNIILTIAILITLVVAGYVPPSMGKETPLVTVKVDPEHTRVNVIGSTFSINVTVKDAVGLLGYDIQLAYDTTVLDGIDIDIKPFIPNQIIVKEEIDDAAGNIWVIVSSSDPTGVSGDGTLFAVTFNCTGLGYSLLDLHDVELSATVPYDIEVEDGDVIQFPGSHGPRSDVEFYFYHTQGEAFEALCEGRIDILDGPLMSLEQVSRVENDPDLQIAAYTGNDMYQFDLNNNATITDYPTSLNPMSLLECRQAVAYLIDKDHLVQMFENLVHRIDAPVPYPQTEGWVPPIPPQPYDPDQAAVLLASIGFNDTDGNGYLNYPDDPMWGDAAGKDTTEMPLKIVIPTDFRWSIMSGRYLYYQLEGDPAVAGDSPLALANWPVGFVGGDWDTTDEAYFIPRDACHVEVFLERNYHIYFGSWMRLGRFPPSYLFRLYHSMFWQPYGYNYVTNDAHPYYDLLLEEMWYADSLEEAQEACQEAIKYHVGHCITIPLFSSTSFVAWRKEICGVVNMVGYGLVNDYTMLNAYNVINPTIRIGEWPYYITIDPIQSWKRECADRLCEVNVLMRMYTHLISFNPYDLTVDQPWAAQDWEVGTWVDPRDGYTKTVVTYYIRKDVGGISPDESMMDLYDSRDYEFTVWYIYSQPSSPHWSNFMDIHHVEIVDDYTVKVYFDDSSMWFVYAPTYPLLGPKELLVKQQCRVASATFTGADLAQGEYQFTEDQVIQVINATVNDTPIQEGEDFYIRAGHDTYCHNVFVNLTAFAPTDIITIYYYTPGGWMFPTYFYYSTHYPAIIQNDYIYLKKNPYFFLEIPLLGEVDWRWHWDTPGGVPGWTIPGRDSGYYEIDILDVIAAAAAYCSRGDGVYDPVYMPGADLDRNDVCHIGLLDIVTITNKYGKKFGRPPPDP